MLTSLHKVQMLENKLVLLESNQIDFWPNIAYYLLYLNIKALHPKVNFQIQKLRKGIVVANQNILQLEHCYCS